MYRAYFRLTESPFSLTPDPRFLYLSERHQEALAHLLYGVASAGGFVQLTGEVGTGKTTLCRALLAQTPPNVDVALVLNPRQTAAELVATVCDELGVTYPPGTDSLKTLVDLLSRHLLQSHAAGRRTVVVIDEAQWLRPEALEQVRLLTNLETPTEKLLQIILIGQPELRNLMARPELRQIAQRITARYHLVSLTLRETRAYIRHRLQVAGCEAELFTRVALRQIHGCTEGIPRLINILCDRALLGAYARQESRVDRGMVRRAFAEVTGSAARASGWRALAWPSVVVVFVLVAGVITAQAPWSRLGGLRLPFTGTASPTKSPADEPRRGPDALAAPTTPALPDLLGGAGAWKSPEAALANLFARWGAAYPYLSGSGACAKAEQAGLICVQGETGWQSLLELNRPAVLTLDAPDGRAVEAVAVRLSGDRVVLDFGAGEMSFTRAEVDSLWRGRYFLVTRKPPVKTRLLREGSAGRDVLWLREQLDRVEGVATSRPIKSQNVFDAALKRRVIEFQKARRLMTDGIVGEETLAFLSVVPSDPTAPLLLTGTR